MQDILSFNTFIAQNILIFFYYIGAIFIPILIWYMRNYFINKFSFIKSITQLYNSLSKKDKFIAIITVIMIFLFMQLFWRMMFEAMIGYFDMHNYLYKISHESLKD